MWRKSITLGIAITVMLGLAIPALGMIDSAPASIQANQEQVNQGHVALLQQETPTDNFTNVSVGTASFDTLDLENVTFTDVQVRSLTIENATVENGTREAVTQENVTVNRIAMNGTLHNVTMQNLVVSERNFAAALFGPSYVEQNMSVETFQVSIRVLDNRSIDGIVIDELTVQSAEIGQISEMEVTTVDGTPTEMVAETPAGERPVTTTNEMVTEAETPVEGTEVTGTPPAVSAGEVTIDSIENMTVMGDELELLEEGTVTGAEETTTEA
jgi:hypothetical protein